MFPSVIAASIPMFPRYALRLDDAGLLCDFILVNVARRSPLFGMRSTVKVFDAPCYLARPHNKLIGSTSVIISLLQKKQSAGFSIGTGAGDRSGGKHDDLVSESVVLLAA